MTTTNYFQVRLAEKSRENREILIALLADAGYEGFEETHDLLLAYIPGQDFNEELLQEIVQPYKLAPEWESIEQRNWNAEWEAGFKPVQVGDFCRIRADFHPAEQGVQYDVVITPKMSFGTGHHATTYQMVDAMKELSLTGKTVLDFGTGTGILAILASKMGAQKVLGIDNDSWSIENALENLGRNAIENVSIQHLDSLDSVAVYDIILANINKHVILNQLQDMIDHCSPGGLILISGLLCSDEADLSAAIEGLPLTLIRETNKDSWLCWTLERTA